jgi:hypothetical protein
MGSSWQCTCERSERATANRSQRSSSDQAAATQTHGGMHAQPRSPAFLAVTRRQYGRAEPLLTSAIERCAEAASTQPTDAARTDNVGWLPPTTHPAAQSLPPSTIIAARADPGR